MSDPTLRSDPIRLFSDYVKLTGIGRLEPEPGDDVVQLNFTRAFTNGEPCPPQESIDLFGGPLATIESAALSSRGGT